MSTYTEDALKLVADAFGNRRSSNQVFSGHSFTEFSLGPVREIGDVCVIENAELVDCTVQPGEFAIRAGVVLKHVVFETVSSRDSMIISSNAVFENVVIKGQPRSGGIWVRPDDVFDAAKQASFCEWAGLQVSKIETMLDVSEFRGQEVTILGWPVDKVRIDSNKHVVLHSRWREELDWDAMGISRSSFFRISLQYMRGFEVEEGIFSLPNENNRKFEQTMDELQVLREAGVF
jgi:hypothetical protein